MQRSTRIQKTSIQVKDLGLSDFREAYRIQQEQVSKVILGHDPTLILCEHPVVLTQGRLSREENLLFCAQKEKGVQIEVVQVNRGGDVTLHAPGQLVMYPILDLHRYNKDIRKYIYKLEQVCIDFLRDFDIVAKRDVKNRGVWVGSKKIASVGVGIEKWVSFHGMAINVNTDLDLFSMIRPCGLDVQMTSLQDIKEEPISMDLVKKHVIAHFNEHFIV